MRSFELAEPNTLREAIGLLGPDSSAIRPASGFTAVMLMMKSGLFQPARLVSLQKIETKYATIVATTEGGLRLGALASLSGIEHGADVIRIAPVIGRTMRHLSNVRVRNVARLGGTLAHGDPHMDLPPVLAALRATVTLTGRGGDRRVEIESLCTGAYETVLAPDELITFIDIPPQAGWTSAYLKCTAGSADDWPALGVAGSVKLEHGVVADVRLMASAAVEKLTRLVAAEAVVRGRRPDEALLAQAADAAEAEVSAAIVGDSRGSAAYKTELLRVQVKRALRQALARERAHDRP